MANPETPDLVAFLTARLEELEMLANKATASPWVHSSPNHHFHLDEITSPDGPVVVGGDGGGIGEDDARHVIAWQPSFALADIAAKWQILDAVQRRIAGHPGHHVNVIGDPPEAYTEWDSCAACLEWNKTTLNEYALRLLALPFTQHPDYRPEWAPGLRAGHPRGKKKS